MAVKVSNMAINLTYFESMKILKKIWLLDDKYSSKDMIRRCWRKANCLPTLDQINLNNDIGHRDRSEKQIEI